MLSKQSVAPIYGRRMYDDIPPSRFRAYVKFSLSEVKTKYIKKGK